MCGGGANVGQLASKTDLTSVFLINSHVYLLPAPPSEPLTGNRWVGLQFKFNSNIHTCQVYEYWGSLQHMGINVVVKSFNLKPCQSNLE